MAVFGSWGICECDFLFLLSLYFGREGLEEVGSRMEARVGVTGVIGDDVVQFWAGWRVIWRRSRLELRISNCLFDMWGVKE